MCQSNERIDIGDNSWERGLFFDDGESNFIWRFVGGLGVTLVLFMDYEVAEIYCYNCISIA